MSGIRWTQEDYENYLASKNNAAVSSANVEPAKRAAAKKTHVRQAVHPRVSITVHSKRRRPVDPDGISAKAAIDGLVRGGILEDDSPTFVEAVTYSQERAAIEETIIEVWEVKP